MTDTSPELREAYEHLHERLDACKRGPGGNPQNLTDHAIEIVLMDYAERGRELERLHSWAGLMSLLDEHYPANVFTAESSDPGARIVVLTRVIDELRARDAAATAVIQAWRTCRLFIPPTSPRLIAALDELARAHRGDQT